MEVLAVDTETTGIAYWDTTFCVTAAWRNTRGELESEFWKVEDINLDMAYATHSHFVFHNAKFDLQKLHMSGTLTDWNWENIHDTECMSHLLNEQRPKALKKLAKNILGLETDEETILRAERRKLKLTKADGYDRLPLEVIEPYARKDAEFTLLLYEAFWPHIEADKELLSLYRDEQLLMGVLYDMQRQGLAVDEEYVEHQCKTLADSLLQADLELRDMVEDEEFNPNSWQQIQEAFSNRDIKLKDTSKETLASIDDDLARLILRYRKDSKLYKTYFKSIREETKDGIFHPWFRQWGTRGRRFSSGSAEDE